METAQKSQAPQQPGNSYTGICLTALVFIIIVIVVYFVCSNHHHDASAPAGTGTGTTGTGTGGTGWCKAGKPDGCNQSCDQNCCNDICAKRFPNGSGSCQGNPPYIPFAPCLCNFKC